jgi:hypothetical protein
MKQVAQEKDAASLERTPLESFRIQVSVRAFMRLVTNGCNAEALQNW